MKTIREQFPTIFSLGTAFEADGEYFFCMMTGNYTQPQELKGTSLTLEYHHDGRLLRLNRKDVSVRESNGAIFMRCHTITLAAMPGAELPEATCLLLKEFIAQSDDRATVTFLTAVVCEFPWANTSAYRKLKAAITAEVRAKRAA